MRLHTIWIQAGDGVVWLETAWDESTAAEMPDEFAKVLEKAEKTAEENGGLMRVVTVEVAQEAVFAAFDAPVIAGTVVT